MTAFTGLSTKGQVVGPKATRDGRGWSAGTDLDVIEAGDAVTLHPRHPAAQLTVDDAMPRFLRLYRHDGPAVRADRLGWSSQVDDRA